VRRRIVSHDVVLISGSEGAGWAANTLAADHQQDAREASAPPARIAVVTCSRSSTAPRKTATTGFT
jgi:hypothetical protein